MKKKKFILYLLLFLLGGLLGGQIPGFVDQYTKRVDAHLIEARINFSGFLAIAQQLHGGSVEALIEHHRKSTDLTFNKEADVIEGIYNRVKLLEKQSAALTGNIFQNSFYVLTNADKNLFTETYKNFSPQILFNKETIIFACLAGALFCFVFKIITMLKFLTTKRKL